MRVTENELIVYSPEVKEIARHELYPSGTTDQRRSLPAQAPGRDHQEKRELLKQRFAEVGSRGVHFLEELLRARRNGKDEAARTGPTDGLSPRRPRACIGPRQPLPRFLVVGGGAHPGSTAKPRTAIETLVIDAREQLDEILRQSPLAPCSTADYQPLLEDTSDEESHEGQDDEPDDPVA